MSKTYECRKTLPIGSVRDGSARLVGTELALLLLHLERQTCNAGAIIEWETLCLSVACTVDPPVALVFTARAAAIQL